MANSGLLDGDFYGLDSSNEDLKDMDKKVRKFFQCMVASINLHHLFNTNKWKDSDQQLVIPNVGVCDILSWLFLACSRL
jgi:hypothetical protein